MMTQTVLKCHEDRLWGVIIKISSYRVITYLRLYIMGLDVQQWFECELEELKCLAGKPMVQYYPIFRSQHKRT